MCIGSPSWCVCQISFWKTSTGMANDRLHNTFMNYEHCVKRFWWHKLATHAQLGEGSCYLQNVQQLQLWGSSKLKETLHTNGLLLCRKTCYYPHLNQNHLLSEKNGHHSDQVLYTGSGQKAVQRLFFKFEEHSCWMVIAGLQSRLLFGSDILTRVIAAVSASTKPHSSWSSDLWLESDIESHSDLCLSHVILGAIILLVRHKLAATTFRFWVL